MMANLEEKPIAKAYLDKRENTNVQEYFQNIDQEINDKIATSVNENIRMIIEKVQSVVHS